MSKPKSGFTLIELVVVIAILGILAGIAIPRFLDAQATARATKILADMRSMESSLTLYMIDNNVATGETDVNVMVNSTPQYLNAVPIIPTGTASFPNGYELNLTSAHSYQIWKHKSGYVSIALKYGNWDLTIADLTQ